MDSLDFNLHQAILSSLAASFSREDNKKKDTDKGKHTEIQHSNGDDAVDAAATAAAPQSSAGQENALSRFGFNAELLSSNGSGSSSRNARLWRLGDANALIAVCEYLRAAIVPDAQAERVVLAALEQLGDIRIERCLGAQGSHPEWLLPDQLAFHLATASIALQARGSAGHALSALFGTYGRLKSAVEHAEATRVIEHILPCLHGIQRAVQSARTIWPASALSDALAATAGKPLSAAGLSSLHACLTGSFAHSSADGRAILSTLAKYEKRSAPFVANVVTRWDMRILQSVIVSLASADTNTDTEAGQGPGPGGYTAEEGWERLRNGSNRAQNPGAVAIDKEILQEVTSVARHRLEAAIQALRELDEFAQAEGHDEDSENDGTDQYELDCIADALKIGTALCLLRGETATAHAVTLDTFLSEQSPVYDSKVQMAALDSVAVLAQRFPNRAEGSTALLRRFITSPLRIFTLGIEDVAAPAAASPLLQRAAETLAICFEVANQDDQTLSTVYSLLNYLPSTRGDQSNGSIRSSWVPSASVNGNGNGNGHYDSLRSTGGGGMAGGSVRSPEERALVSSNTLVAVTHLAKRLGPALAGSKKDEMRSLALGMMLQRLRNSDLSFQHHHDNSHVGAGAGAHSVESTTLLCVAELAGEAKEADFVDIVRALTEFARSSPVGSVEGTEAERRSHHPALHAASLKLANCLDGKPQFAGLFLRELLVLFMDQSSPIKPAASAGTGAHHRHLSLHHSPSATALSGTVPSADRMSSLRQLLDTLALIETLLALPTFHPHREHLTEELALLFRNFWLISTASGLASSAGKDTQLHRACLKSIAAKTPSLLHGTPLNYTETELEYNPILRREHGTSSESLRAELAPFLSNQSVAQSRTVTYPQVVFLLAVARLETFRAELGDPSFVLRYFHNPGVNNGPLAGPLAEIATRVTEAFIRSFGQRVRRHAMMSSSASRLKEMVLQCSNTHLKARIAAIKSLDSIFAVFPILLCDATLLRGILDSLTLLRDACESEMDDEFSPIFEFRSERADITLVLPDDYDVRNEMLATMYRHAKVWLAGALAASPAEMIGLLQDYLDVETSTELRSTSGMGQGVALELARQMPVSAREAGLPDYGGWRADTSSVFSSAFGTRHTYGSEAKTVFGLSHEDDAIDTHHVKELKDRLRTISEAMRLRKSAIGVEELRTILYRAAAVILAKTELDYELLREIVFIPLHAINPPAMHLGVEIWAWLVDKRADVEQKLMVDLHLAWAWTVRRRRGLFSALLKAEDPINSKTEYSPTDIAAIAKASRVVRTILTPHRYLLEFLSSRFQAYRYRDRYLVLGCMRLVVRSCQRFKIWGKHPLCRELRMKLLTLGFSILNSTHLEASLERTYRHELYAAALSWFEEAPTWSYGADRLQMQEDVRAIQRLLEIVRDDANAAGPHLHISSRTLPFEHEMKTSQTRPAKYRSLQQVLILHLENEIQRLAVWINPLGDAKRGQDPPMNVAKGLTEPAWTSIVRDTWTHSPRLAILMRSRFKNAAVAAEVHRLVLADPLAASSSPEALDVFLGSKVSPAARPHLKNLVFWAPVSPVSALRYFLPAFNQEPLVLQYAMRVLEQHPVDLVFFYVPQVVQALRTDPLHYMERFIFETSKISQLFCHQIIWNMKANAYKDDLAEVPDPDKAVFERMVDLIVSSLSGEAKKFYEKEFGFFNEVTSISRKLMPLVKKTKPEKKAKIDEEMAKIKVEKGVYLPSHPEGQVIDIDRHSGRPLQSHAKTPFMATFKVSREYEQEYNEDAITSVGGEHTKDHGKDGGADEGFPSLQGGESGQPRKRREETMLSAIFKVGDDCRQDVLALQVIAQFKNMFNVNGLDLQVQPYRVLATGPGTGIIDVVPNATSRDEMGRAKINDLTSFFLFQFGPQESVAFQRARSNFIQSMAAYSVLCYILQLKDRHNGNIMIDGEGRITHIDFGFLFDIDEFLRRLCGIKFEPNSFKLTHEMITLMGGKNSQGYRQFCELTVKAFLACRPYAEDVVSTCRLMMPTDFPSFKGEGTIDRIRDRFKPDMAEREAANYMMTVIDDACENSMSIIYDRFQYAQNRIPYAK